MTGVHLDGLLGGIRTIAEDGVDRPLKQRLNVASPLTATVNGDSIDIGVAANLSARPPSRDFLVIGQSLAAGLNYVPPGGYPADTPNFGYLEGPDIETWNGNGWVQASAQDSGEVVGGIGLFAASLARRLVEHLKTDRVRVMMAAQSAQGVWYFNPRNLGGNYASMINAMRAASFNPGTIVYWQGYSDGAFTQAQIEPNYNQLLTGDLNVSPGRHQQYGRLVARHSVSEARCCNRLAPRSPGHEPPAGSARGEAGVGSGEPRPDATRRDI